MFTLAGNAVRRSKCQHLERADIYKCNILFLSHLISFRAATSTACYMFLWHKTTPNLRLLCQPINDCHTHFQIFYTKCNDFHISTVFTPRQRKSFDHKIYLYTLLFLTFLPFSFVFFSIRILFYILHFIINRPQGFVILIRFNTILKLYYAMV